jgi:hypothetical protein
MTRLKQPQKSLVLLGLLDESLKIIFSRSNYNKYLL